MSKEEGSNRRRLLIAVDRTKREEQRERRVSGRVSMGSLFID